MFELVLFYTSLDFAQQAYAAGISTFMIDWEQRGKRDRQQGFDTQINYHSALDLKTLREALSATIVCRINQYGEHTRDEVELAIGLGANEILLPMVRSTREIEETLELICGRCGLGVMVETWNAVQIAEQINELPLQRAYVGLNDLAIDRHSAHVFVPLVDQTLDHIRHAINKIPLGFAGLTLTTHGYPLPCAMLINEMARLSAKFSVLRRSFLRDIQGHDLNTEVVTLHRAIEAARQRTPEQIDKDHLQLLNTVNSLPLTQWKI